MRDHHLHAVPILAGMWGGRKQSFPFRMREQINNWKNVKGFGGDQEFLAKGFLPYVAEEMRRHNYSLDNNLMLTHDSVYCENVTLGTVLPFPVPRFELSHVGQVFKDINDTPWTSFRNETVPVACRRRIDWYLG